MILSEESATFLKDHALNWRRNMQEAAIDRHRKWMKRVGGGDVEIARLQLAIAKRQISFENQAFLIAAFMGMAAVSCAWGHPKEQRAPFREGIVE